MCWCVGFDCEARGVSGGYAWPLAAWLEQVRWPGLHSAWLDSSSGLQTNWSEQGQQPLQMLCGNGVPRLSPDCAAYTCRPTPTAVQEPPRVEAQLAEPEALARLVTLLPAGATAASAAAGGCRWHPAPPAAAVLLRPPLLLVLPPLHEGPACTSGRVACAPPPTQYDVLQAGRTLAWLHCSIALDSMPAPCR